MASLADFLEDDSVDHVDVLLDDYSVDTCTPMSLMSADTGTNQFGPYLMDLCKQCGLRIVNGRFGAESGKYTYLTDRGSSVVNYVLATQNRVYEGILSDHCFYIFWAFHGVKSERKENFK